jgi:hypothetical protein
VKKGWGWRGKWGRKTFPNDGGGFSSIIVKDSDSHIFAFWSSYI